jgi:GNAT superfamily N-acetyltransferase
VVGDLLVTPNHRGRRIGKLLLDEIGKDYPHLKTYVMSDVDAYYEKQGYCRVGSIFEL